MSVHWVHVAVLVTVQLAGCSPLLPDTESAGGTPGFIGTIYHYERSNIDGTEAEQIYVYRESHDHVVVYKMREKCTNAAYVTATIDQESGIATSVTGGRLLPGAQYENFAYLEFDPDSRILEVTIPGTAPEKRSILVETVPWHLFDFDFASLNAMSVQWEEPKTLYQFGLPLVWADPSREDFLQYLGELSLEFDASEVRNGIASWRYEVSGSALEGSKGRIWFDAEHGHIVDAQLPIPNHLEYSDFRLRLVNTARGDSEWRRLLTAHFDGCQDS